MDDIRPIGVIHSVLTKLSDCPLQEYENAPVAIIELHEQYVKAAEDIKVGSEIILLTWLDKADRAILKTKPRNNPASRLTGVFSTRSPDRPNPIGVHYTKVLSIERGGRIKIASLEVIDQTPIIDIKPRMRGYE